MSEYGQGPETQPIAPELGYILHGAIGRLYQALYHRHSPEDQAAMAEDEVAKLHIDSEDGWLGDLGAWDGRFFSFAQLPPLREDVDEFDVDKVKVSWCGEFEAYGRQDANGQLIARGLFVRGEGTPQVREVRRYHDGRPTGIFDTLLEVHDARQEEGQSLLADLLVLLGRAEASPGLPNPPN